MRPFDTYPGDGIELLEAPKRANTRREDAPRLRMLTGQTTCAYCEIGLFDDYHRWLLTAIDHVVPRAEAVRLGIPVDWYESFSNAVLCCSGCNGLDNRFRTARMAPETPWTLEQFFELRNSVFLERRERIAGCRRMEEELFGLARGHIRPSDRDPDGRP